MNDAFAGPPSRIPRRKTGLRKRADMNADFAAGFAKEAGLPLPLVKARNVASRMMTGGARAKAMSAVPTVRFHRGIRVSPSAAANSGGMTTEVLRTHPRVPGEAKKQMANTVRTGSPSGRSFADWAGGR